MAPRNVLVFGVARELDAAPWSGVSIHRSPNFATPADAMVLDLRDPAVGALTPSISVRARAGTPLLILCGPEDEAAAGLPADDVVTMPAAPELLGRRVRLIAELGSARAQSRALHEMLEETRSLGRDLSQREVERYRLDRLVAMGTMVAGFAHEVRNPVAALRSIAEELAEVLTEAHVDVPHVGRMLKVLERIEGLVRASLQLGRPPAARRAAHRPWTIVSQALTAVGPRLRALGNELRIELEPDLPDVYCDDGQTVQALVVLVDNAIDATGSPDRVLVRASSGRGGALDPRKADSEPRRDTDPLEWIFFDVCDDGPGIAAAIMRRVFDPFFTTKSTGTGLGLSIAQQLVGENGGRIEVQSRPGGPTTFTIAMPGALEARAR